MCRLSWHTENRHPDLIDTGPLATGSCRRDKMMIYHGKEGEGSSKRTRDDSVKNKATLFIIFHRLKTNQPCLRMFPTQD